MTLPEIVHDGMGRPLKPGQVVVLTSAVVGRVVKVARLLDPGMPPNTLEVQIQATRTVLVSAGAILPDVFITLTEAPKPKDEEKPASGLIVQP